MIKKLSIVVGVLVGLLVVAAVAVSFVDVNYFKPQIANFVATRYNRTLSFEGDLKLSIFPHVGVTLPEVRLSEPNQPEQEAASLTSAQVSVALLPLLKGDVQADTVTIDGLKAKVVRQADGSMSIDDLLGAQDAPAQEQPAEPEAAAKIPAFHVNGVTLANAPGWPDLHAGATQRRDRTAGQCHRDACLAVAGLWCHLARGAWRLQHEGPAQDRPGAGAVWAA